MAKIVQIYQLWLHQIAGIAKAMVVMPCFIAAHTCTIARASYSSSLSTAPTWLVSTYRGSDRYCYFDSTCNKFSTVCFKLFCGKKPVVPFIHVDLVGGKYSLIVSTWVRTDGLTDIATPQVAIATEK